MISVRGVSHRYRGANQLALDQLDLSIGQGELFGLLGPNGAGKSTLITLLCGLRKLQAGHIEFDGTDMSINSVQQRDIKRRIAWVPQEYAFYPSLTVAENLRFFAQIQDIDKSELADRMQAAMGISGLEHVAQQRAAAFSGGLKRRLNIAISLLRNPDFLFLDEPTVGIDPQSRHFLLETIRDINAAGTTVIYSSHYMEEVEALCKHIAIIDHGKLLQSGSLQELRTSAGKPWASVALEKPLPENIALEDKVTVAADRCSLSVSREDQQALANLLQLLASYKVPVQRIDTGAGNLEQLFLQLTHRSLRD